MERVDLLLIVLLGIGGLWLGWQGIKLWLRRSISVDQATLDRNRPSLLYFYSEDCAPCLLQQSPILDEVRESVGDRAHFEEYDAVAYPEVAGRYRVLTVPTTVIVAPDGRVTAINYGVAQADKLQRQLAEAGLEKEGLAHPCRA